MSNMFVIIGSNSFSGSHFVHYLLNKGINCIGISRSNEPNDVFLPYKSIKSDGFKFYQLDINFDLNDIVEVINDSNPNYLVNFAAQGMVAESWKKPEDWYQTNVVAQVKLHNQLRKIDSLKKYVHITTPEVYGSTDGWISESYNFYPSTPYAVSRAACDMHLNSFFKSYKFPVNFTRAANVYGPHQQLYRIIPRTILYARLGKKLKLHGGGFSERSFINIHDVVDATYRVALNGIAGNTYHISTLKTISIRDLVIMICKKCNVDISDLVYETEDRLGKDQSYMLNSDKIRNNLKWEDKIDLEQGISSTIEWVDENLETLKIMPHEYIHKS